LGILTYKTGCVSTASAVDVFLIIVKICGSAVGGLAAAGKTTGRVRLRSPKCFECRMVSMKAYRILVSSGGELPEIVLPAAASPPTALPRFFSVFEESNAEVLFVVGG